MPWAGVLTRACAWRASLANPRLSASAATARASSSCTWKRAPVYSSEAAKPQT